MADRSVLWKAKLKSTPLPSFNFPGNVASFWTYTDSLCVSLTNRTDGSIHQRSHCYSYFSLISSWTIVYHNFTYFIIILSHNLWFSYFPPFYYAALLEMQNCMTIYFETMMSGQVDFKFNAQHDHFLNHYLFNIYSLYFGKASNSSATKCPEKSRSHELCDSVHTNGRSMISLG